MDEVVMGEAAVGKTPTHLWVLGILALLWNCVGAYDYLMSNIGGLAYFESAGLDAAAYSWFQAMPVWAVAAWAIGVWGSVLGALLLLIRSRHAVPVYLVSIAGAVIAFVYQFTSDRPASMQGGMATVMPLVILILIVAQWYYARRMAQAGVLR
jgi:hypothetical protein